MTVDITSLGDVNVDLILKGGVRIEDPEDEQKFIESCRIKIGGGAANFSIEAAKLGMKVRMIGSTGNDFFSEIIQEEFRKANVEFRLKKLNVPTGITLALQTDKDTKFLLTFLGNNKFFSISDVELEAIEGEVLYLSGYNLLESLRKDIPKIVEYVKKKGMIVGMDPDIKGRLSFDKNEFFSLAKEIDILFINEQESKKISNDTKWFKGRTLVIKKGSKGAVAFENKNKCEVEGIKLEGLVNTTGAGDVFNAAFLHHYYYGYDLQECLEFANERAVEYIREINSW